VQISIDMYIKITYALRCFQKAHTSPNRIISTLVLEVTCIFLGENPDLGQELGLQNFT
jgi:hypothetical protein